MPVGCIVTDGEHIVGRGRNRRETGKSALAHAELEAVPRPAARSAAGGCGAARSMSRSNPPMCARAIINARIPRVVFGAPDSRRGS